MAVALFWTLWSHPGILSCVSSVDCNASRHTMGSAQSQGERSPRSFPQRRLLSQVSQPFLLWVDQTSAQEVCAFTIKLMSAWHCTLARSSLIWILDSFQEPHLAQLPVVSF